MSEYKFDKQVSGDFFVLKFVGYFNEQAGQAVKQAINDSSESARNLVLNLEKVSVINSSGITQILELVEDFTYKRKGQVAMIGVSQLYQEVFQIVGLTSMVIMSTDEESAIQQISASV